MTSSHDEASADHVRGRADGRRRGQWRTGPRHDIASSLQPARGRQRRGRRRPAAACGRAAGQRRRTRRRATAFGRPPSGAAATVGDAGRAGRRGSLHGHRLPGAEHRRARRDPRLRLLRLCRRACGGPGAAAGRRGSGARAARACRRLRRERREAWRRTPMAAATQPAITAKPGGAARHSPGVARATWRPGMPRWPTPRRRSAISRAPRCCAALRPRRPGLLPAGTRPAPAGRAADAGGDRRLRPAAHRPRRPRGCLRYVPARGRRPGRGGSDARRTTVGGQRHAAERRVRRRLNALGRAAPP